MKRTEWVRCPVCGGKTCDRIREDTVLKNYPLYCPKCKQEALIDVKNLRITVITEPDTLDAGLFPLLDAVRRLSNLDQLNSNLLDLTVKKHRRQKPAQFRLEEKRMAYNNGRENRKWLIWKEAEEKKLPKHGVDENTIEQIRTDDRADFNSNLQDKRMNEQFVNNGF